MPIHVFGSGVRAHPAMLERIDQYREVFAEAVRQKVRRTGLTDDLEENESILIGRMNAKRRKAGCNTDWKGDFWNHKVA